MINSTFQVTFGIEIEAVLAFNQSLLQNHLDSIGSPSKIIKDIPDTARRDLNQASSQYLATREKWMSWALTTPTAYSPGMSEMRMQEHFEEILLKYGYRGYGGEILDLAQSLLPEGVRVHDHFGKNKYDDFSHWHLTHDRGVYGVGKERLADQLRQFRQKRWENRTMLERIFDFCRGREAPAEKIDEWDTHGLELVSRVLPYEPSSFAEIERECPCRNHSLCQLPRNDKKSLPPVPRRESPGSKKTSLTHTSIYRTRNAPPRPHLQISTAHRLPNRALRPPRPRRPSHTSRPAARNPGARVLPANAAASGVYIGDVRERNQQAASGAKTAEPSGQSD